MNRTVIICIDGLDPEYLEAGGMPVLTELSKKGFHKTGRCMMPSVTNVNNVSLVTASYPETHGICSNFWYDTELGDGTYVESGKDILAETMFQRARKLDRTSILVTSKDKLRTLLGDGATFVVSSEQPPDWVVSGVGPSPDIYSLEVNGWAVKSASYIMSKHPANLVYITTTDYAMHTYGPDHPQSQKHLSILDEAIGELVEAHPDITLLVTADHGMSRKSRMVDLKHILESYHIRSITIPIIKDRYVVHHANLGGCMYLYVQPRDLEEALKVIRETPGVEDAIPREEAVARFRLSGERIGDIVVTGEEDVVFGDVTEVEIPPNLRTHGSTHEGPVPLIGYNGDFAGFSFEENRDIGRYVFERVLA
jgi:phosphonoacetate hydrolase